LLAHREDAIKIVTLAATLALLAAPASAGDHKAQIQGYADAWPAAYNNHDVVSLAKMNTDDAEMSTPTASRSGKAAILENFKKEFATNAMKFNTVATTTAERIGQFLKAPGRRPREARTARSSRSAGIGWWSASVRMRIV
jgi:hypothetical protein